MIGKRRLLGIALSLGGSVGCAGSRAALGVSPEALIREVHLGVPLAAQTAALRGTHEIAASFSLPSETQGFLQSLLLMPDRGITLESPDFALGADRWTRSTHPPLDLELPFLRRQERALAAREIRRLMQVEFSAASELQEVDVLSYGEEFHLGRAQDDLLDVKLSWRQRPGSALIGMIGAPRTLDQDLEEAILDPRLVFVALGVHLRW